MTNNSSSHRLITNTANQIGYLPFSSTSDRFSGFFSYPQDLFNKLFTMPIPKSINRKTIDAIEETKGLNNCPRFETIDDLFNDLEN
jgi:hypothetical protein